MAVTATARYDGDAGVQAHNLTINSKMQQGQTHTSSQNDGKMPQGREHAGSQHIPSCRLPSSSAP